MCRVLLVVEVQRRQLWPRALVDKDRDQLIENSVWAEKRDLPSRTKFLSCRAVIGIFLRCWRFERLAA